MVPKMKPILSLQIAILALAGMVSAMSLIFFAGGDNCWEGSTDVSSDLSPREPVALFQGCDAAPG